MRMSTRSLPSQIDKGGISIRATDWGDIKVANLEFPAGANATPLLEGLPGDLCQCPHWGVVLKGSIHVRYADGSEEEVHAGDAYHWPSGHTVWVDEDFQAIEFSPREEMTELIAHLAQKLALPPPSAQAPREAQLSH